MISILESALPHTWPEKANLGLHLEKKKKNECGLLQVLTKDIII